MLSDDREKGRRPATLPGGGNQCGIGMSGRAAERAHFGG